VPAYELAECERHLARARDLAATAASLSAQVTGAVDFSDMYRAAFVQGVSALDTFVHAEVRVRMLNTFELGLPSTQAFERFRLSMASVRAAIASSNSASTKVNFLEAEIREQHSYLSFQQPNKIAEAVRLVSDVKLWDELAKYLGIDGTKGQTGAQVLRRRLTLIIDRRNTIVHESDIDPTPPGDHVYPISRMMADDALDVIDSVVHAIAVTI